MTSETIADRIAAAAAKASDPSIPDERRPQLERAVELGCDEKTLVCLIDAMRTSQTETVTIPSHRFERLSRGSGWCRKGRGDSAEWGERTDNGYRVGPGKWTVGGSDGFTRKGTDEWTVSHVQVGPETWTIAV